MVRTLGRSKNQPPKTSTFAVIKDLTKDGTIPGSGHGAESTLKAVPDIARFDQVIGDYAQSYPTSHALESVVATTSQPVTTLDDTDPTFTPGPPPLSMLEPALLLQSTPLLAARASIRNRNILHPQRLGTFFIHSRVKTSVGSNPFRNPAELALMGAHGREQQVPITGPAQRRPRSA